MIIIKLIGTFYLIIGFLSLTIPLVFIKLGRPRDLIKSGLIILLGVFLIIYQNIFNLSATTIQTLYAILIGLYVYENFSYRWNQLLDKEKFEIKSLNGFINNFSAITDIIKDGVKNLFSKKVQKSISKNNSTKKKWVRGNGNNTELIPNKSSTPESISNSQTANFSKEDIINDEKNKKPSSLIDKK